MSDAEDFVEETAVEAADWDNLLEDYPLATVRLWHRSGMRFDEDLKAEVARTSQRKAIALLAKHRTVVVAGGNRSGKTYSVKAAFLAIGLGSDHPMARAFWLLNDIDPDDFPKGPANAYHNDGEAWAIAVDSGASKEYHRTAIEVLLQPGSYRWHNRDGKGVAELYVTCPGYDYPAIFRFKSDDQGRKRMQGQKCRVIWHDEEGKDDGVWDECATRLTDTNGWHILSNTPLDGFTWVWDRLEAKTDPDRAELDAEVYRIHAFDNPYLDAEGLAKLGRGDPSLRAAKLRGEFVSREGLVYRFDPNVHVVAPFDIPPEWPRYKAVDFGTRAPFACVWAALSPDDRLIVYREYNQAEQTLRTHALRMRELEGWVVDWDAGTWTAPPALPDGRIPVEQMTRAWADPEDPQQMMQLVREWDVPIRKAIKHVNLGIDAVAERLDPAQPGGPALVFFSTCTTTIQQHRGYAWAPKTARTEPDRPAKKNDHTCDDVRYIAYGLKRGTIAVSGMNDSDED